MVCSFQFWQSTTRTAAALVFVLFVAGCALSPEQLSLPSAITGSTSANTLATVNARPGVDTADPADKATETPRAYEGSGQFTKVSQGAGGQEAQDRQGAHVIAGSDGVTLNLVAASVAEVAKSVLGDTLHLNYTVSDKIKTAITLSTTHPIPKEDLLKVFESILASEGIAIVVDNGVYKIVPRDATGGGTMRLNGRGGRQAGTATEAIPLRYVSAAEMERVLKAVAPQISIVRVDSARNLLLVSGSAGDLNSVRDAVVTFDVDWMRGMSFAILPVESSADPEAIAQELDTIFANDQETSPTKGIVRFVPNTRLKSVLVISSRPEYLRKAAGWLRRIDMAGQASERQVHVYHVQNRAAAELASLLQKVYNAQSGRNAAQVQPGENAISTDAAPASGMAVSGGVKPVAAPSPLTNAAQPGDGGTLANLSEPAAGSAQGGRGGIGIVPDEPNNSLVITATAAEYKRIRQILARIDVAANQVLIEATIAEVTLNDQLRFGLKWFFRSEASGFALSDSALGAVAPTFPGFSYFLNMPSVKVALDALSSVTEVNVVSSPSLMVLDNKKAVLQIGDEVPVATQSAVSVTSADAPIVNAIAFRNTGVILNITPRVSDNGRILLDIEQEVSDVVPTTSSKLDSPTIQQRRIKTTVAVNDGESVVLAGLMKDDSKVTRSKAPLAGDIPVIGNLFKQKDDSIRRTELLIAITPHVVKDRAQLRHVVDEFRDRINLTTRPQRKGPPDRRENADRVVR